MSEGEEERRRKISRKWRGDYGEERKGERERRTVRGGGG